MGRSLGVRGLVVAALSTCVVLAGCGGDDGSGADESATDDPASTTTEAAAASTTTAAPTTTEAGPIATTSVEIAGYAFGPEAISVAVGDTVTWTNLDEFQHTTTQDSPSGVPPLWDSGTIDPQGSFQHTFTEAGSFDYVCNIHNYMRGTVVVE